MEKQVRLVYNGQAVQQQDYNLLGETAALADDRVLAELFRMAPYDGSAVAKGILTFAHQSSVNEPLIAPNDATGSVLVRPFRALVGSRTEASEEARKNWRDIRSGVSVAEGATALTTQVTLAPNDGFLGPRWDLVYAIVTVDTPTADVTRKVKDVDSAQVTAENVSTSTRTTVTVASVAGTPHVQPVFPPVPADTETVFNIPLGYVRVPGGFTATSTVPTTDIAIQAPFLSLSRALGGQNVSIATSHHTLTTTEQQNWGGSGTRKRMWIPPDAASGETLIATIDMQDASAANWSHQSDEVVDSRDWRNRFCRAHVMVINPGANSMPWNLTELPLAGTYAWHFGYQRSVAVLANGDGAHAFAMATTLVPHEGTTRSNVFTVLGNQIQGMADSVQFKLYVDHSDGGKLKVQVDGAPTAIFHCWLEFSGPYLNK